MQSMSHSLLFALSLLLCGSWCLSAGVGDRLERTFLIFADQPLTVAAALSAGWTAYAQYCDPSLGIAYSQGGSGGPTASNSPILYFTSGGQVAGFGVRAFAQPPAPLVPDFWRPAGNHKFDIAIAVRNESMMCSGLVDHANPLGDRLVINQHFNIPLTMQAAESAGWVMGNCIGKMGIHHAFDLNKPGSQTWNASSLVPVMPMYNSITSRVSAVLFWMSDIERLEPFGDWEGPFPPFLFCKNWCANTGCQFPGVDFFSTMHWMLTDPSKNTCEKAKCVL